MKESLEKAVEINAQKASERGCTADEALKFTQAAVNASNALRAIKG